MPPEESIPAMLAPPRERDNPLTRSAAGIIGMAFLALMFLLCLGSLPWTTGMVTTVSAEGTTVGTPRYNHGSPKAGLLPPAWWPADEREAQKMNQLVDPVIVEQVAIEYGLKPDDLVTQTQGPAAEALRQHWERTLLGTDALGRSLLVRVLTGGGISLGIGIAAALISVMIGTVYGAISAYAGGRVDAVMMRIVDVLYGLPYILLVVLLAVAGDAVLSEFVTREKARQTWIEREVRAEMQPGESLDTFLDANPSRTQELRAEALTRYPPRTISEGRRAAYDVIVLLAAIAGVSWLTMARVIRGQVLSLKAQPFVEAARSIGVPLPRLFLRHLLPNLLGPIIVYATLTVPQAILQESFLSFLGIGVKPPLPSWGNLAADGLHELNTYKSRWWLLVFPCVLLGTTLLAMNFVGEGLREAFDPKRAKR